MLQTLSGRLQWIPLNHDFFCSFRNVSKQLSRMPLGQNQLWQESIWAALRRKGRERSIFSSQFWRESSWTRRAPSWRIDVFKPPPPMFIFSVHSLRLSSSSFLSFRRLLIPENVFMWENFGSINIWKAISEIMLISWAGSALKPKLFSVQSVSISTCCRDFFRNILFSFEHNIILKPRSQFNPPRNDIAPSIREPFIYIKLRQS